jgi:hypothetical protein
MQQAAAQRVDLEKRLQEIFKEAFGVNSEDNMSNAGYQAYAYEAIDVSVRFMKMFIALKKDKGVHDVMCDLVYQLNTNNFWQKNAAILVPILQVILNTHRDGVILLAERANRNEYSSNDALISASRAAPLEIFPVIAYCLGGPVLQTTTSIKLKMELAPYIL